MKKFRFPLDPYLALLRREMEGAEAKLAELRGEQQAARRQSDEMLQQRQQALERLSETESIGGEQLRGLDAWRGNLAQNAMAAQNQATKLERPIQQAKVHALEIRRRVELMEKLREQRLAEHQRLEDRQIEQTAAELHLAARQRRTA